MICASFTFYDWLVENDGAFGSGPGLWCPLHISLMCLLFVWLVAAAIIFRRHKKFALTFTKVLCWMMVFFRLFRMALLLFSGKQSFVEVLPWHLCHVMSFVFPIFFLTKTKKFFLPVLVTTFFGGILTFIFGNYYNLSALSFLHIESLWLHFSMPTVAVACLVTGYFKVRVRDFWQVYVGLGLLCGWSMIANLSIEGANYLYLMENGLPFNLFPGASYLWTYLVLVVLISAVTITPFVVAERRGKRDPAFQIIMQTLTTSP